MQILGALLAAATAGLRNLPSLGWCILLGDLIALLALQNALARRLAIGGAIALFTIYAVALWKQEGFWHDDVAAASGYVEGFPESVNWHGTLAFFLDRRGDLGEAEQEIRASLRLEPDRTGIVHPHSNELHHMLGELLARRGNIDGAVSELQASVNCPLDEDQEHPPREPLKYNHAGINMYNKGLSAAGAGRTRLAIQELKKGLDMMQRLPVPDYEPVALWYIPLAEFYDSIGDQEQVEAVLKEVDSMSVGELAVGLARAEIRLKHNDKEGAERILQNLAVRYPDNYEVWIRLAKLQLDLKQYDQALNSYQRAGGGWFGSAKIHSSMAKSLHAMGRDKEALDQCRLAEAISPRDWAAKFACAQIRYAVNNK